MRRSAFLLLPMLGCTPAPPAASDLPVEAAAPVAPAASFAPAPPEPQASQPPPPPAELGAAWLELQVGEEVLALLAAELKDVSRAAKNLAVPDLRARRWFDPQLLSRPLQSLQPAPSDLPPHLGAERFLGVLGPEQPTSLSAFAPLAPLLSRFQIVEDASFSIVRGWFLDAAHQRYLAQVKFSLGGEGPDGAALSAHGTLELEARFAEPAATRKDRARWAITRFALQHVDLHRRADGLLFEDVAAAWLPPDLLPRATGSLHEDKVSLFYASQGRAELPPDFDPVSHDRHPALSVVDIDGDGRDELYVMGRWGPNLLLQLDDDGRLHDIAPALGLDLRDHSTAALFADFDNDGDPDLFLGRSFARSLLLANEDGRFVDRSDRAEEPLPMLVSGLSAADVDSDGLLDLYVATYSRKRGLDADPSLAPPPALAERLASQDVITDAPGPRNLLLLNRGDRWERAPDAAGANLFRQTFQGTFADVDGDGAPDLYLANDYAPNTLLRNRGDGSFEDVTEGAGAADLGFGMGASFGDSDGDGDLDLYVSNMFSKAGKRVTDALPGLDPRYAAMARGNSLFRNDWPSFPRASGRSEGTLQVEATGWSWSGLFADVDADGWLDLAVPNGYFTPPPRWAQPVDL